MDRPTRGFTNAILLAPLTLALLAACERKVEETTPPAATPAPVAATPMPAATPVPAAAVTEAKAELSAVGASGVTGTVTFTEAEGKVTVEAHVNGLKPGKHGFHIHEFGDCSAPDASSAGGHFNPGAAPHGAYPGMAPHHSGDLGNLIADATGHAMLKVVTDQFTLAMGANNILGRAVIVHEKEDDFTTQPTGNAGGRQACGVILDLGGTARPVTAGAAPMASPEMSPMTSPAMPMASPATSPR